jgi:hypothetical protein
MKSPTLVFIGAALLGIVSARAEDLPCKEPFSQTHAFSPTGSLRLDNINGHVEVRAWDRNEILVEGEKSATSQEVLNRIKVEIKITEDDAIVTVHLPKRHEQWFDEDENIRTRVTFRVSIPATATIAKISCVNSGIDLEGLRGPVTAQSVNGGIRARGLGGDARLHSVNGPVSAAFATIAAGQKLSLDTVNGGVTVRLPKDAGLTIHCSVLNGGVDCALPLKDENKGHHRLTGTIGDGRATLKADSVNGGIRIEGS